MTDPLPSPAAAIAQTHRLFFALLPPAGAAAEIGEQRRAFGVTRSPVADDRLHITLAISTDHDAGLPDALVAAAIGAGANVAAAPFRVLLDEAVGSAGSVALRAHEPLAHLATFQRTLAAALSIAGVPLRDGWRFNPHVTLGYRKGAPFAAPILPIAWDVADFVLVHSHVGLTRHDPLARWPLRAT